MRRHRLAAAGVAILMFVAVPAALAAYTGTYAPTQSIAPRQLLTPTLTCTAPSNNSVSLTWSDADATTSNPYTASTFVISGYVLERQFNNGTWNQLSTPGRTVTTASDNNFGLVGLGDQFHYRIRSTKSTNWVSANSATVTAEVTSLLIFTHVNCPA